MLKNKVNKFIAFGSQFLGVDLHYFTKGSFWLSLNQFTSIPVGFILSLMYANLISKQLYGQFTYVLSFVSLFSMFAYPAMDMIIAPSAAKDKDGIFRQAILKTLPWGLVSGLMFLPLIIFYLIKPSQDWLIIAAFAACLLITPIIYSFRFWGSFLVGKKQFKKYFYFSIFGNLLNLIAMATVLIFSKNLLLLVVISLSVQSLTQLIPSIYILSQVHKPKGSAKFSSFARKTNLVRTLSVFAIYLDKIIIGKFLGFEAIAVYSFAEVMPQYIKGVFKNIITTSVPKLANLNKKEISKNFLKKMLPFSILAVSVIVAYIIASPFNFHVFFPRYNDAVFLSQLYAASMIFGIPALLLSHLFQNQIATNAVNVINIVKSIISIILVVVFLILWGLMGVILARLMTQLIALAMSLYLFRKNYLKSENRNR